MQQSYPEEHGFGPSWKDAWDPFLFNVKFLHQQFVYSRLASTTHIPGIYQPQKSIYGLRRLYLGGFFCRVNAHGQIRAAVHWVHCVGYLYMESTFK